MKILIAVDMEGVTGVVHWDHVNTTHAEYQRFRALMTNDVNAAVEGAFAGGAEEVTISDGHAYGRNILVEDLDPRARLNAGTPAPLSMVQGADLDVSAVFFVGYHARAGSQNAILDHTWSDTRVANLRLNGELYGEIGLNASVCGHFGVPVIMISGDQTACGEAAGLLGPVEQAVVKRASSRMAAECLPPGISANLISEAAERAVCRLADGDAPAPFRIATPVLLSVEFNQSDMADRAALMPGARRTAGRCVEATLPDVVETYRAFRTLLALARE